MPRTAGAANLDDLAGSRARRGRRSRGGYGDRLLADPLGRRAVVHDAVDRPPVVHLAGALEDNRGLVVHPERTPGARTGDDADAAPQLVVLAPPPELHVGRRRVVAGAPEEVIIAAYLLLDPPALVTRITRIGYHLGHDAQPLLRLALLRAHAAEPVAFGHAREARAAQVHLAVAAVAEDHDAPRVRRALPAVRAELLVGRVGLARLDQLHEALRLRLLARRR